MLCGTASAERRDAVDIGSEKQLFIDDALIAEAENVTLTMNPPRKTGERCIVADKPWESHRVCAYNTVIEDGVYKMWYDAIAQDGSRWLCYATSTDGVHWEKPDLGLVEFDGSKANNIVFPPERRGHEPGCVFIDTNPDCPTGRARHVRLLVTGRGSVGTAGRETRVPVERYGQRGVLRRADRPVRGLRADVGPEAQGRPLRVRRYD